MPTLPASDWSVVRIYPCASGVGGGDHYHPQRRHHHLHRLRQRARLRAAREVAHRQGASDWSVVRIYPSRVRLISPS
eukprot:834144-Prorocentrum_minimum.AAC.1